MVHVGFSSFQSPVSVVRMYDMEDQTAMSREIDTEGYLNNNVQPCGYNNNVDRKCIFQNYLCAMCISETVQCKMFSMQGVVTAVWG